MPVSPEHRRARLRAATRKSALGQQEKQLEKLTAGLRRTWLTVLGFSTYVLLTVAGISHSALFSSLQVSRLPIIEAEVSILGFLQYSSLILMVVYCYFHVSFVRLWKELDSCRDLRGNRIPIHHWLLVDWYSQSNARSNYGILIQKVVGVSLQFLFVWYPIAVVVVVWWQSHYVHSSPVGMFLAGVVWIMLSVGWTSLRALTKVPKSHARSLERFWGYSAGALLGIALICITWTRTEGYVVFSKEQRQLMDVSELYYPITGLSRVPILDFWLPDSLLCPFGIVADNYSDLQDLEENRSFGAGPGWEDRCYLFARPYLVGAQFSEREAWQLEDHPSPDTFRIWCENSERQSCEPNEIGGASGEVFLAWQAKKRTYLDSIPSSDLRGVDLRFSRMAKAFLPNVDLRGASLNYADIRYSQASGANFFGSSLIYADLSGTDFSMANFNSADLTGSDVSMANFFGANLHAARLANTSSYRTNFSYTNLSVATFKDTFISNADFTGVSFSNTDFLNVVVSDSNFQFTKLSGLEVRNSVIYANRPRFGGFEGTDFTGLTITGSAFRNIDLSAAVGISQETLECNFGDASVLLPAGLSRPAHWSAHSAEGVFQFMANWRYWRERHELSWPPAEWWGFLKRTAAPFPSVLPEYDTSVALKDCSIYIPFGRSY